MDAKNVIVDDDAQGQEVEHVGKVMPDVGVAVFSRALCVKAVGLCDATGFVVPSNQVNAIGVSKFQAN